MMMFFMMMLLLLNQIIYLLGDWSLVVSQFLFFDLVVEA
jgi:hypothetical protein